ncbi:MAG: hypothetical protein ACI9C9_002589 [Marivirga sp.]|jgi:hypothetical protein
MRVMPFGSIRFLTESTSSKSKRIRFKEFWLFLIRICFLAATVLFLAGLFFKYEKSSENWLIVGNKVELPEDFIASNYQKVSLGSLINNAEINDGWSFLNKIARSNPQIDSIVWVDEFEDIKFLGAIPDLPFHISIVDKNGINNSVQLLAEVDTLHYWIEGINRKDSILIARFLKTIENYVAKPIALIKSEEDAPIGFSLDGHTKGGYGIEFIVSDSLSNAFEVNYVGGEKVVMLSKDFLRDERKHQELLIIIAENITQYVIPSFEMKLSMVDEGFVNQKLSTTNPLAKWPFSDEVLIGIILLLLLIERYMVYHKNTVRE